MTVLELCSARAISIACALFFGCASSGAPPASSAGVRASEGDAHEPEHRALSEDLWPARVLALVNEHRHAAGALPLAPSAALSEVAADAARECFEGGTLDEQAVLAHAHARLERQSLVFRRVSAVLTLAESPKDAAALEAALDPDALSVGVGVARGALNGAEELRTAVVLVLGTPR